MKSGIEAAMTKKVWNEGRYIGRKPPFTSEQVQLIKLSLKARGEERDLLLFCMGLDSSLRGVDLVKIKVKDVFDKENGVKDPFQVIQSKTGRGISCILTNETKRYLADYITKRSLSNDSYLFTSLYDKEGTGKHITPDHYRDLIKKWLKSVGLNYKMFASHSLRRSRTSHLYKETGNLRACQLLLGHSNIQNTAIYLGIEEEQAHEIARKHPL